MGNDWLSAEQRRLLDRMLDEEGVDRGESPIVARGGDRSALPLSFAQQRMWFFHRLQPASTMYNIVGAATLRGHTDPAVLQACVDELVRRHEVLRSTFHLVDAGASVQRVNPPVPVPMPFHDLRDLDPAAREDAVRAHYQQEIDRPFDLTKDLLLRPTLLRVADEEHLLLLSQHHIATDGWSLGILLQELAALHACYAAGGASTLPEPELHYGDFALWQQEWQATGALDEHLKYWRERLTGAHALDLPTGRLRTADRSWDGGMCEVDIPAGLVGALKALGESERATLFMVLLAAVSTVLSRWTGQQDLVVGVPVANRNRGETESLVGSFVNTLPMRVELTGEPTFRELLRHVRQEAVDAYAHQDVPFEKIIEEINPEREASAHTPLIRHMLGLHNTPWQELRVPGLAVDILTLDTGKARFDLEFELTPTDSGAITGQLWFAADIMDEAFVRRLLDSVYSVLAAAVADPETPVWRLPLAVTEHAPPSPVSAAPLPALDPALPVVRADQVLTGGEFGARVAATAAGLRTRGVVAGSVVALRLPHTADLAVALHAVLAAGAVALPLDPALTRAEVDATLAEASPRLVLTTAALLRSCGPTALDLSTLTDTGTGDGAVAGAGAGWPDGAGVCLRSRGGRLSTHAPAELAERVRAVASRFPAATVAVSPGVAPDLLVSALLWPVVAGGCVVLGGPDQAPDQAPDPTADLLPDLLLTTPAALAGLGAAARRVVATGEQLWPDAAAAFARAFPGAELVNLYAVTEVGPVAAHVVDPDAPVPSGRIPVGSPLGARPEVRDERGEPVPDGVAGDLYVSRSGTLVATGDRARWNLRGELEILGSPTGRTIVQGRPAELGDLVAELTSHPAVSRAHFSRGETGELIAHAVPRLAPAAARDDLRERFTQDYLSRDPDSDPLLNLTGWRSPHSGADLPAAALREWLDGGVRHILDSGPRRVLEIGCRNGGLLFRLAPRCDEYRATELSGRARRSIERQRDRLAAKADVVELADRAPDDLAGLGGDFDTVVVNGLAAHCPDPAYLERILVEAVKVTRPGGVVFVSDVADLTARSAAHLAGEADHVPADTPASRLREAVARRAATADGLALHPDWFRRLAARLPGVRDAAVLRRLGTHPSELTQFRFDAVLHLDAPDAPDAPDSTLGADRPDASAGRDLPPVLTLDWGGLTVDGLAERLASAPETVVVRGVPVRGLVGVAAALDLLADADTVGEVRQSLDRDVGGVDPAELVAAAAAQGFDVVAGPSGDGFAELTVALRRQGSPVPLSRVLARAVPAGSGSGPLAGDTAFAEWARSMPAVLRSWLRDRLPLNAVPVSVEPLTNWPHRPDGAVDTAAFATSTVAEPRTDGPDGEPRTQTQKTVLSIWADILGVDRMGIDDDFFALGGHSLMGALVVDRLREEFALDLPLGQLFQTPTVAEVSAYIDGQSAAAPDPTRPDDAAPRPATVAPIRALDRSSLPHRGHAQRGAVRSAVVPTSFAQRSMWLENELDPGQATYHVVAAVRLVGDLDRAALQRGLNTVVARHEALHTVFELDDDGPVQVIGAPPELTVEVTDVDPSDAEAEEAAVAAEVRVPFDLERGPLVRLRLLRTAPDRHIAVLTMHHIVTDGLSSAIFVAELAACYLAYQEGREPELPPLGIQYADFAVWQREHLTGDTLDALARYWTAALDGAPALALATDRPRPAVPSADGATHGFALPAALVREVEALARAERATPFMAFLAAFDVLLARYSGQRDITVVSPMAGRIRPEVENLIGFFVNPLVLRVDLGDAPTARELIARTRATCSAAYEHQEYPFELALEVLRTQRGAAAGSPQAQAMLVLQNQPPVDLRAAGLAFEAMRADTRTAGYELALDLEPDGTGAYRAFLEYSRDLFDESTAVELAGAFVDILAAMVADPAAPVDLAAVRERRPAALAAPEQEPIVEVPYRAPRTPIELELHEVFSELLGVEKVGLDDGFFVLGGDSLSLIQLRNRIRDRFGVEFRVRDLTARVDIDTLARQVLQKMLDQEAR